MAEIVRIAPQIANLYKEVRLRALHDDPAAFCSTYEREAQLTDADWNQRSISLDGEKKIGFLALENGEPCGLVACFRHEHDPSRASVISMWVAPTHRGTGLARNLLDAIRKWAYASGIFTLHLDVISNNPAAIKFYERYGFTRSGRYQPYPNDPQLFEIEMTRPTFTK